ncbi:tautomerase family protein [Mycobacterium sp. WMMD1722]|uniref:tautomerase family protein n=1 Tax=Mycobacterium sp. WMMD1722 TaxID=3404117 RepID=UPI003BF54FC7
MPLSNLEVSVGTSSDDMNKRLVDGAADLFVGIYGDQAGPNVMAIVNEVVDGGWGIGGQALAKAMLAS